jgi:hypothetical protein
VRTRHARKIDTKRRSKKKSQATSPYQHIIEQELRVAPVEATGATARQDVMEDDALELMGQRQVGDVHIVVEGVNA